MCIYEQFEMISSKIHFWEKAIQLQKKTMRTHEGPMKPYLQLWNILQNTNPTPEANSTLYKTEHQWTFHQILVFPKWSFWIIFLGFEILLFFSKKWFQASTVRCIND